MIFFFRWDNPNLKGLDTGGKCYWERGQPKIYSTTKPAVHLL